MYRHLRTVSFLIFANVSFLAVKGNSNVLYKPKSVGLSKVESTHEIPFIVSVQYNKKHFCGGSLYGVDSILTAAHCLYSDDTYSSYLDPTKLSVLAGSTQANGNRGQRRQVGIYIVHPNFAAGDFTNDIAIIIVTEDFTRDDTVNSISLRSLPVPVGEKCYTAGWGVTKFKSGVLSNDLKKAELESVGYSHCIGKYGIDVPESLMCAYRKGEDSCQGDSGGPLVCEGKLSGVVSRGRECATSFPGLYTNVSYFHKWIQQTKSGMAKPILSINIFLISIIYLYIYNTF